MHNTATHKTHSQTRTHAIPWCEPPSPTHHLQGTIFPIPLSPSVGVNPAPPSLAQIQRRIVEQSNAFSILKKAFSLILLITIQS